MMPPQMSHVTETPPKKYCPRFVPRKFWTKYLQPIFLIAPDGITFKEVDDLFVKMNGYRVNTKLYGYKTIEEMCEDIEELCVFRGKVFYDWGFYPQ